VVGSTANAALGQHAKLGSAPKPDIERIAQKQTPPVAVEGGKRTSDEARLTHGYKPKVTMPCSSIRHAGLKAISQEWSSGSAT